MKIEIKPYEQPDVGTVKAIYVDDEPFDWGAVKQNTLHNPVKKARLIVSVRNHFVNSFSEFIGKKVTLKQINEAIESGVLE